MARNSIPDQPENVSPQDADSLFIWSDANARLEHVKISNMPSGGGGGASTFLELTDTPANYTDTPDTATTQNPNPKVLGINTAEDALELQYNISRTVGNGLSVDLTGIATGWNSFILAGRAWGSATVGDTEEFWNSGNPGIIEIPHSGYYTLGFNLSFRKTGGIATPFGAGISFDFYNPIANIRQLICGHIVESTSLDECLVQGSGARYFSTNDRLRCFSFANETGINVDDIQNCGVWIIRHAFRANGDYPAP